MADKLMRRNSADAVDSEGEGGVLERREVSAFADEERGSAAYVDEERQRVLAAGLCSGSGGLQGCS